MARGQTDGKPASARRHRSPPLPPELQKVLAPDTARAWTSLAPILPDELYLGGGTAVAVHLHHRESRDLDLFFHRNSVDLTELEAKLKKTGQFAITHTSAGTLRGLYGATKVEFFHVDEGKPQRLLEGPKVVAGLRIAGLKDLAAMKVKVIGDRGEMRDYFDLKSIEEQGSVPIEDAVAYFLDRYNVSPESDTLGHTVRALGYLDDIEPDDALPISKAYLAKWWHKRQGQLVRRLARNPL